MARQIYKDWGPELPKTMNAAVVGKAGPPDVFQIAQLPTPHLTRGHVIIAIDYASVNPWDLHQRSGAAPVERGEVLGLDGSGTVVAAASDVEHVRAGDRVRRRPCCCHLTATC